MTGDQLANVKVTVQPFYKPVYLSNCSGKFTLAFIANAFEIVDLFSKAKQ